MIWNKDAKKQTLALPDLCIMDNFTFLIIRKSQCWCDICQQGQHRALPWLSGGTQGLPFFLCRFLSGCHLQRETNFLDSCWVGLGFSPAVHTWMMLCSCFIRYCVCVCAHVYVCVSIYVCLCVCCIYVCVSVCIYVSLYVYACVSVGVSVCIYILFLHLCVWVLSWWVFAPLVCLTQWSEENIRSLGTGVVDGCELLFWEPNSLRVPQEQPVFLTPLSAVSVTPNSILKTACGGQGRCWIPSTHSCKQPWALRCGCWEPNSGPLRPSKHSETLSHLSSLSWVLLLLMTFHLEIT